MKSKCIATALAAILAASAQASDYKALEQKAFASRQMAAQSDRVPSAAPCPNGNVTKGRVEAIRSVSLIPQIEGHVSKVCFSDGGLVKKGTLLFQLESERFQHQVNSCTAELAAATFMVKHAQREYDRMVAADSRGITQVEVDATSLQYETAKSNEKQAQAGLALANFELEKTKIAAPFDGRIGASAVSPGSFVSPFHAPMAKLVQLDPIRVVFPVSAAEYVRCKKSKLPLDQVFKDVRIVLPDGTVYDHPGKVDFENNVFNDGGETVNLGASFPNPDQLLMPNAVVDVQMRHDGGAEQ